MLVIHRKSNKKLLLCFFISTLIYVEGHGIHLAANAIARDTEDTQGSIFFFDEQLGHYIWYGGLGAALIITIISIRNYKIKSMGIAVILVIFNGITWATNGLEGGTAIFSLAFTIAGLIFGISNKSTDIGKLVLIASLVSSLIFTYWAIRYSGFPQPSSL